MNRNNGRKIAERLMILQDFLIKNADKTHAVSMEDIRRHYENKGVEGENSSLVNVKTVYRDLDALGSYYGLDIVYDEKRKGYVLMNPPFEQYQLRLLVDSVQASRFITQQEARKLTEKIQKQFGNDRNGDLNRQAFVYNRIRSMNESVVRDADRLHEAIAADRKVSFRYAHMTPNKDRPKLYSRNGEPYVVSPYALYWSDGNYYLYAYDGKIFRYFRVDRMENISPPMGEPREGKELYDAKSLTNQKAKMFQMYSGQEYNVVMRFRNGLADAVIDQFGRDTLMMPVDSEHFEIEVPVQVSPPFYAWVSTFGRSAKILAPAPVVEGMRAFLQNAMDMYKDEGDI